jgi:hypothetical protein
MYGTLWTRLPQTLGPLLPLDEAAWAAVAHLPPQEQLERLGLAELVMEVRDAQGRVLGIGPLMLSLALLGHLDEEQAHFRHFQAISG